MTRPVAPKARRFKGLAAVVACLPVTAAASAQSARIENVDGTVHTGVVDSITMVDGRAQLRFHPEGGAAAGRMVPLDEVVGITFESDPIEASSASSVVWLRRGLVLHGTVLSAADGVLRLLLSDALEPVHLPVHHLRAMRLGAPLEQDAGFLVAAGAGAGARPVDPAQDLLFARRDDEVVRLGVTFQGLVAKADPEVGKTHEVMVSVGGSVRTLPLERVYGVVFSAQGGLIPDTLPGQRIRARFQGDQVVEGVLVGLDQDVLHVALDEGPVVKLARRTLVRMDLPSARLSFLGNLTPTIEQVPAMDRVVPIQVDRTARGGPIRLQGISHARGLVVVPWTRLRYPLEGRFDWFETSLGIEDGAGPLGDCSVRILADGEQLFVAASIKAGSAARFLKLDVQGRNELVLEVGFGANLDLGDHLAFASARVWRER